jgi:hypothetical protein
MPDSALVHLSWPEEASERLRPDAAASIDRLAVAFCAQFHTPLRITDSYRTYAEQVTLKAEKGAGAATPGTSNHGFGIALDMASLINQDGSATHRWFEANAPRYGWINPAWAVDFDPGNGSHEAWHWEYHPELDRSATAGPTHTPITPTQEDDLMADWTYEEARAVLGTINNLAVDLAAIATAAKLAPSQHQDTIAAVTEVKASAQKLEWGILSGSGARQMIATLSAQVGALQALIAASPATAGDSAALVAAAKEGALSALQDFTLKLIPNS